MLRIALFAAVPVAVAPAAGLTGTVFDARTRLPVPYAEVRVVESDKGTLADSLGRFSLSVPDNRDAVSVEAARIGYLSRTWTVMSAKRPLSLFLTPERLALAGIIVSAFRSPVPTRLSGPVTVLTDSALARGGRTTLAEGLGLARSSSVREYGNLTSFSLRGANAEQTLVLLDGIRLNSAQDNLADLTNLPLTLVGRVEVTPSAGSALYGANSLGGIADVITPDPDKFGANVCGGLGSFGRAWSRLVHTNASGPLGYVVAANLDRNPNHFTFTDSLDTIRTRTNADIANTGILAKGTLNLGPHTASLLGEYNVGERGVPGSLSWPSESASMSDRRLLTQLRYGLQEDENSRTEAALFLHQFFRNYSNPDFATDDTHRTTNAGANLSQTWHFADWGAAMAGTEVGRERLVSTSVGTAERWSGGVWLQGRVTAGRLTVTPSVRADYFADTHTEPDSEPGHVRSTVASPRLWLTLDLPPLASLYAGLGRSYRQPTFNELYWPADQWTRGNPRLEPEWSTNLDLGASARPMRFLDCGAGLFHNRLSNLIQWQSDSNYVYQPVNVERATITGAEFEFTLHTGHARVRPGMTWLLARSDSTDLIYRPRLSFTVEHSVEWHWARLSWDVRYTGSRLADPASGQTLPSHLTLDTELALTPRLGPVLATIRTGCRNLFDRRYQVVLDYPVPGRNLYAELGLTI